MTKSNKNFLSRQLSTTSTSTTTVILTSSALLYVSLVIEILNMIHKDTPIYAFCSEGSSTVLILCRTPLIQSQELKQPTLRTNEWLKTIVLAPQKVEKDTTN